MPLISTAVLEFSRLRLSGSNSRPAGKLADGSQSPLTSGLLPNYRPGCFVFSGGSIGLNRGSNPERPRLVPGGTNEEGRSEAERPLIMTDPLAR